ncbi:hypothetical protein BJV74DRAFT_799902 [Russula compacta]|nr:hypothetical protein BJV74DRAFT_799902 [Russula compacta]
MITRATNANKHPGRVVINTGRVCHPREVVQAEHTSRAAEKEKIAATEKEGIDEVARLKMTRKKKGLTHQQRNKVTIPRAMRARNPRATTPIDQGYLDSDGDYTVEVEQLEPQPEATKKKPSGSEQSAKVLTMQMNGSHRQVPQLSLSQSQSGGPEAKAGSDSEVGARPTPRKAQKTKGSEALSGLVPGWKKIINVTSQPLAPCVFHRMKKKLDLRIQIWSINTSPLLGCIKYTLVLYTMAKGELFLAVKGLVKWGISTRLHKFAIAAERALVAEFEQQDIHS